MAKNGNFMHFWHQNVASRNYALLSVIRQQMSPFDPFRGGFAQRGQCPLFFTVLFPWGLLLWKWTMDNGHIGFQSLRSWVSHGCLGILGLESRERGRTIYHSGTGPGLWAAERRGLKWSGSAGSTNSSAVCRLASVIILSVACSTLHFARILILILIHTVCRLALP